MQPIAEFKFENAEAMSKNENVFAGGLGDIFVKVSRVFRTSPLPGMKQPAKRGVMMGMETILLITHSGKPVASYRWVLRKNGIIIQRGTTDSNGLSGDVDVDLPHHKAYYTVSVFEPTKRKVSSLKSKQ